MHKFKVGDLVRVHPKYQTAVHRSDKIGRITSINHFTLYPIAVQFKTHYALFKAYQLEKI